MFAPAHLIRNSVHVEALRVLLGGNAPTTSPVESVAGVAKDALATVKAVAVAVSPGKKD
jgi:hypothetical protein